MFSLSKNIETRPSRLPLVCTARLDSPSTHDYRIIRQPIGPSFFCARGILRFTDLLFVWRGHWPTKVKWPPPLSSPLFLNNMYKKKEEEEEEEERENQVATHWTWPNTPGQLPPFSRRRRSRPLYLLPFSVLYCLQLPRSLSIAPSHNNHILYTRPNKESIKKNKRRRCWPRMTFFSSRFATAARWCRVYKCYVSSSSSQGSSAGRCGLNYPQFSACRRKLPWCRSR